MSVFLYCGGHHDSDRTAVLVWSPRLKLLYCKYHQFMYTLPNKDFLPSFLPSFHIKMTRKDKGDQPSGGETTWTNTGATRYGRGQHKTGSFGDDMLRPSPNHGTQRLPNDDDEPRFQSRWGAVAEWVRALDWRPDGPGFESHCGKLFASELWQFRLPCFASVFRRRH